MRNGGVRPPRASRDCLCPTLFATVTLLMRPTSRLLDSNQILSAICGASVVDPPGKAKHSVLVQWLGRDSDRWSQKLSAAATPAGHNASTGNEVSRSEGARIGTTTPATTTVVLSSSLNSESAPHRDWQAGELGRFKDVRLRPAWSRQRL
jgi:hypothetical protein